jgi:hypothetical protein
MKQELKLEIAGLGIVFYSPFAVADIPKGSDFLSQHFMKPQDVASFVNACTISAIGTGSPGSYLLRLFDGPYPNELEKVSRATIRLGIEVRDGSLCFRDLYDFMEWDPVCPAGQQIAFPNGFFRITVCSSRPASGILGRDQGGARDTLFIGEGPRSGAR